MVKKLLALIFVSSLANAHTPQMITQAIPYRTNTNPIEPFLSNKKAGLSYNRIYMDARPMIGVTPVVGALESEFEADFYSCIEKQAQAMIAALQSTPPKVVPKLLFINIRQYEGSLLESFCRPSVSRTGDLTIAMAACYAGRSTVQKQTKCLVASQAEISESFAYLAEESSRRESAFSNLKKTSEKLLEIISK